MKLAMTATKRITICARTSATALVMGSGGSISAGQGGYEECDDGNLNNDDGCTVACTTPRCGDGVVVGEEVCDDGNRVEQDACRNNYTEGSTAITCAGSMLGG